MKAKRVYEFKRGQDVKSSLNIGMTKRVREFAETLNNFDTEVHPERDTLTVKDEWIQPGGTEMCERFNVCDAFYLYFYLDINYRDMSAKMTHIAKNEQMKLWEYKEKTDVRLSTYVDDLFDLDNDTVQDIIYDHTNPEDPVDKAWNYLEERRLKNS